MAHTDHDGIIDSSLVYNHKRLASILGRDERWIKALMRRGLEYYRVGGTCFISGHAFLLFVERNSKCHDDQEREPGEAEAI